MLCPYSFAVYTFINIVKLKVMETFRRSFRLGYVLILFVLLFSCSSDDDLKTSDGIVGKWMVKEMKMELRSTEDGETLISIGEAINNNPENYIVFNDDNTLKSHMTSVKMTFKGTLDGEAFNYVLDFKSDLPELGKWSKEGDKITISDTEETSVYTIQTLNKSTLKLYGELSEGGDSFKSTLVYSRL